MRSDEQLIDSLRSLTAESTGSASDFVNAVMQRVASQPAPWTIRGRRIAARVAAAVLVMVAAVVPGPRMAVARWLGVGSVHLQRVPSVNGKLPAHVRDLDLGAPSTIEGASSLLGRAMSRPRQNPVGVWTQGAAVNAVYLVDGTSVLVSELPGPGSIFASKKMMGGTTRMDFFTLRNEAAVWISGAPHEIAVQTSSGEISIVPVRLAGDVLLWADTTRTIRIEGFTDRSRAVAFFETLKLAG